MTGEHVIEVTRPVERQFEITAGGQRTRDEQLVAGGKQKAVGRQQDHLVFAANQQRDGAQGLAAVGSVAEDFAERDPPALHQRAIGRLGFLNIQFQAPDHRCQAVTQFLQANDQGVAPGFVALAEQADKGGEHWRSQDGDAFLSDDAARNHRVIVPVGFEQR